MIAETAVRVRADSSGFESEARGGVLGAVGKVAAAAGAAIGAAKIGKALFVDSIASAGDFEQSLNVLQATSHATDARMKEISATAMKLGNDTKLPAVSASDAANAMLELAKGGFSAKESMEGARGVLLLSTAAQIDGATAATLVADSIHAFGLRAKDAGVVVNDFAGAANASTATMGEVGQALQQSGQAFHQLGVPIGDATTAIAAMANAGIKGSDAGTSLKTMLQRLNPTTKEAKTAMAQMGVSAFDSSGKFVGMREVIAQMSPKLRAMSQEQRQTALNTIFGSDASRAAGIILGQTTAQWDKQHAAVTKAGQAQALADAQTKGFKGAMAALRSSLETVQLQIGLKLLPVATRLVRWLSAELPGAVALATRILSAIGEVVGEVVGAVQAHMDEIRTVAAAGMTALRTVFENARGVVAGLAGAIQNLVQWLNQNRDVAIALASFVATLVAGYLAYQAAMLATRAALAVATAAQWLLNAAMTANPIGIIVVAIAALVAALVLLYQRNETARQIMLAAWAAIRSAAEAAFGFITNTIIPAAIAAWQRFGPAVVGFLQAAASAIRTAVEAIATVVRTVIDAIRQNWDTIWGVFGPLVRAHLEAVRTVVQTVLNVIAGVVRLVTALIRGDWSAAWGALKGIVSDVLNGVVSLVGSVLRGLAGTARGLANAVGAAIGAGVKTAVGALAGLAGDLIGRLRDIIGEVAGTARTVFRQVGFAIADGIISGIGNLASRVKNVVTDAVGGVVGGVMGAIGASSPSRLWRDTVGRAIGDGITLGAELGIQPMGPKLVSGIQAIAARVKTAAASELPAVGKAFGEWAKSAQANFDAQIGRIEQTMTARFASAQAKLDSWKAKLTDAEAQVAARQAAAAVEKVRADVAAAAAALATLPAKQAAAWSQLLAQQKANMDALRATLQSSKDDAILAGADFQKGLATADPSAQWAIQAQQHFDTAKALFDQGQLSEAEFVAAHQVLQDATVAISDNSNAQQLLSQYNTWQEALRQQAAAGNAITTQQAADAAAQVELQRTQGAELNDAKTNYENALAAKDDFYLGQRAQKERADKDARYAAMSEGLKATHDRVVQHLENVQHAYDLSYAELGRMATRGGDTIGQNLAQALRNAQPTVAAASAAVARTIAQYLKLSSPSERGPLSTLNRWWTRFAPTILAGLDDSAVKTRLANLARPADAGDLGSLFTATTGRSTRGYSLSRMEQLLEQVVKHTGATATAVKNPPIPEIHVAGGVAVDASVYRSKR